MTDVHGEVAPKFAAVRDAFARNFVEHGEVGAAFTAYVDGECVVDIWGGVADKAEGRPWDRDTLQLVFSCTKGATSVCANLLAERGELDIDAPVVEYWPEFAAEGKDAIPVRWLLSHEAGLVALDVELTAEDAYRWSPVVDALAAQAPLWEPGTAHGYHAVTFGWLVGEVVRRITGQSLGAFFAKDIAFVEKIDLVPLAALRLVDGKAVAEGELVVLPALYSRFARQTVVKRANKGNGMQRAAE